jgi:drug/metabolite transporter (DMT)-like permease
MQTRKKWLLDAIIFLSGLVAALSGVYFLFIPSGGYQGGRNPMYGVTILFSRHTWEDLHTWSGVLMIAIAVLHFSIHWRWVKVMSKRTVKALLSKETKLSKGPRLNVAINTLVAASFLLTAVSGSPLLDPLAVDQEYDQTVFLVTAAAAWSERGASRGKNLIVPLLWHRQI